LTDIRAVIVDWGGVMTLPPSREAFARLQSLAGLEAEPFAAAWLHHRHAYDLGEVDSAGYWRRVAGRAFDDATLRALRAADAACWSVPNTALVAWLGALKAAGLELALLSNTPREQWGALRSTLTWLPLCDVVVLSCELGVVKPDPTIYRHCLSLLHADARQTLFIDDRVENVEAAERLGMHAIRYASAGALRQWLLERFDRRLPLP
jgi:putative hydrolase of the HAD superfamily